MGMHTGAIVELRPDGNGGIFVKLAGMAFGRYIPGTNLTLHYNGATPAEVLAWYAGVKGGAYCKLTTDGILDQGVSAVFSVNSLGEEPCDRP